MMTKKVVGLLTAAIFVFAFAVGAQADWPNSTSTGDYPYTEPAPGAALNPDNLFRLNYECYNCQKCDPKNVPCPQVKTEQGEQGSVTTTITEVCPFDYDGRMFDNTDSYGYCTNPLSTENCRVVLNACQCPESCDLEPGVQIGIQLTILTPGVYWAEDASIVDPNTNLPTVWFQNFPLNGNYCATDERKSFGEVRYYQAYSATEVTHEYFNSKGKIIRQLGAPAEPLGGCVANNVSGNNRAKTIESYMSPNGIGDYTVKMEDLGRCNFWIDIPAMRLDGTATPGDAINVRVTLLWNRIPEGVCSECDVPIMCECIRTVGTVCCDAQQAVDTEKGCVFFPYVFQGLDAWQSGIAVSALNRTALPDNAKCTLTVQDTAGNTATYVKTDMGNKLVWAFVLDQIIGNFTGANLVPGAVSLKIDSNYRMDGYSFMMAEMDGSYFGAGQLARGCTCSTCP